MTSHMRNDSILKFLNISSDHSLYHSSTRNAEEVMLVVLIVFGIYYTAAAATYQYRLGKASMRLTNTLCTATALSLSLRCVWFELELHGRGLSVAVCIFIKEATIIVATAEKVMTYVVFWLRQRVIYSGSALPSLKSKKIRVISNVIVAGMIILPLLQIIVLSFGPVWSTPSGCVARGYEGSLVLLPLVFMTYGLFQVALLGLVLYPILNHMRAVKQGQSSKMEGLVTRLSVCAGVCIVSDIAFIAVAVRPPKDFSFIFVAVVHSYNALVNVTALFMSFGDYMERFLPFSVKREPPEDDAPEPGTSQSVV